MENGVEAVKSFPVLYFINLPLTGLTALYRAVKMNR